MRLTQRQKDQMERLRRSFPGTDEAILRYNVMTPRQRGFYWAGWWLGLLSFWLIALTSLFFFLAL
jgi:hypothetical protein